MDRRLSSIDVVLVTFPAFLSGYVAESHRNENGYGYGHANASPDDLLVDPRVAAIFKKKQKRRVELATCPRKDTGRRNYADSTD
ncbi:hypothetical protein RUM44_011098 [Polyplax serrata]|uniref:Secreted protein n=1 Tax=Polyplax serrata TaxID=468196 RepID=A0ABR1APD7_POLSC